MKKGEMPTFIQAMYGTVLGLIFYKIAIPTSKKLEIIDYKDLPVFFKSEDTFKFLLFIFTLFIVAHDWFSYHIKTGTIKAYWSYIPQVFSLFFLSQMFVSIEGVRFQYWFAFGFWYTVSNVVNYLVNNGLKALLKKEHLFHTIKYIIHFFLTAFFFFHTDNQYYSEFYLPLIVTFVCVLALWIIEYFFFSEPGPVVTAIDTSINNIEKKISTAQSAAKTTRHNAWENLRGKDEKNIINPSLETADEKNINEAEKEISDKIIELKKAFVEAYEILRNYKDV